MQRDVVIRAEGLGKRYLIGHQAGPERYQALRDVITRNAKALGRSVVDLVRGRPNVAGDEVEEFWALRDLGFEIERGEVVGVIGRNGAGKSTLLKVLSRITEPSEGKVEVRGRVASLLEVGTGFHPELSGRENIYLNGAILGMTHSEIRQRFDDIVAFSEIEQFLDTPVKRYSSGMYVRLAFAVAAHLESEILIVDEVLAVGDQQFQDKCLGKMREATHSGRTVLFVSHNMAAIRSLCTRAIILDRGRIVDAGPTHETLDRHINRLRSHAGVVIEAPAGRDGPRIESISLSAPTCSFGQTLGVTLDIASPIAAQIGLEVEIHDERGSPIAYVSTAPMMTKSHPIKAGTTTRLEMELGPLALATGKYDLHFWLTHPWVEDFHVVSNAVGFEVVHSDPGESGFDFRQSYGRGAFTVPMQWRVHD
jgi:lipopolysaccharide transport system ATP-binding protein